MTNIRQKNFSIFSKYSLIKLITSQIRFSYNKITFCNVLVFIFDLVLLVLVIWCFCNHIIYLLSIIYEKGLNIYHFDNLWTFMNSSQSNTPSTNTTIIHTSDGWAQGIKNIFIYGSGALRLSLLRSGGMPFQRTFIVTSTVLADVAATAIINAINDPNYVEKHYFSWQRMINGDGSILNIHVDKDSELWKSINDLKPAKFIPDDLNSFSENLFN